MNGSNEPHSRARPEGLRIVLTTLLSCMYFLMSFFSFFKLSLEGRIVCMLKIGSETTDYKREHVSRALVRYDKTFYPRQFYIHTDDTADIDLRQSMIRSKIRSDFLWTGLSTILRT